jgi:Acetamidase/Formamidase family
MYSNPHRPTRTVLFSPVDSDDVKNIDLTSCHNLSGPIAVEGAEPGDCLVVDILDSELQYIKLLVIPLNSMGFFSVNAFEKMPWGYTVRLPGGCLRSFTRLFVVRVSSKSRMEEACSVVITYRSTLSRGA